MGAYTICIRVVRPRVPAGTAEPAAPAAYRRSHHPAPDAGEDLEPPLSLTKRGCLVIAIKETV